MYYNRPMRKSCTVLLILSALLVPARIQASGNWKTITTPHFEIIFEQKSLRQAEEVAGFCEDAYTLVTDFFNSYPEKVTCILRSNTDTANGYFSPVPPQINLFITSPSTPLISARNGEWLKVLLIHELTHYVNLTYRKGFFYRLSGIFGNSLASLPAGRVPGWAVEGIAVKLETDFTNGGRGRNPFFEMRYRALIRENKFYSWKKASYPSSFPPADRIYQAGYLINDYMARTYGNDIFVRIYRNYLKHYPRGFNRAVLKTTGASVKEIFASMKKELETKYIPLSGDTGIMVSPDVTGNYYLPYITDRGWILYRNTLDDENAIVRYDPATEKEEILLKTSLTDFSSLSASSDGSKVVFSTIEADGRTPYENKFTSDLFMLLPDTKKVLRITKNVHLRQPGISYEGDKIIAVQIDGQFSRLVSVDPATGRTKIIFSRDRTTVFNPSFSPDGSRIVFTLNDNGRQDVWILTEEGKAFNITSSMKGEKYFPRFTDNSTVVFSGDADGILSLYSVDINKKEGSFVIKQICTDGTGAYSGIISGGKIIYGSYTSKGYCLKSCSIKNPEPVEEDSGYEETYTQPSSAVTRKDYNPSVYSDTPKLIFMLPIPFSLDPLNPGLSPAAGFVSYLRSYLGKFSSFTALTILADPVQPEGELDISLNGSHIRTDYSLKQGYSKAGNGTPAEQKTRQNLSLTLPVYNDYITGKTEYLFGYLGMIHEYTVQADNDFSFPDSSSPDYSDSSTMYGYWGLGTGIKREGSPKDIIPPLEISARGLMYVPVTGNEKDPLLKGGFTIGVPSIFKHQVVRLSGEAGYGSTSLSGIFPDPRGFDTDPEKEGRILGALDYLFTIALTDIPFLSGFSLQGIAGGVHAEKLFDFDRTTPPASGPAVFTGAEVNLTIGYMTVLMKAGIGFNLRINTEDYGSFDPGKDLGIYIYAGTDSLRQFRPF